MVELAMVFPGQGSQAVGMLKSLGEAFPVVRETFAEASRVLGYDLWALTQEGPEAELNRTEKTQPAMLAAGVAAWRVWRGRGGTSPSVLAGHSLGEYTALVCAGAIDFADAVALVADRGRYMQDAVPAGAGAMAAILGLTDEQVVDACERAAEGEVVAAANFNSPGQVVVAGESASVQRVVALARQAGAKRAVVLPVSVPSHCALMRPAAERLAERLAGLAIRAPMVPVVHNVDARPRSEPQAIREALTDQLYRPVRWVECVRAMGAAGARTFVEAGPGKVLTGLQRRILADAPALAVLDPDSLQAALAQTSG
ncbi:MAG: ACP S-malonyltransferase [Gammaproteobacteria bacterium]|nr:ACP S-malonyltransferase [Gammaproteobacteria bacterium]